MVLKYRTVKLAEVGRLMQLLGSQLARTQAGVPVREVDDEALPDAAAAAEGSGVATPVAADRPAAGAAGGGGGKGKKKKGKR